MEIGYPLNRLSSLPHGHVEGQQHAKYGTVYQSKECRS
jgi:hypothetical protein